jgi:hypothetical protein
MPTGGGGTRPADAGPATCSCSGGHPPLRRCLRRTPAIQTPTFWTPTVVPGAAADSPRRPRCPVPQPPRHRPRCAAGAGRRRTRSRRCGATAGPHAGFARLRWSSGQVDAASRTAVRMPGHRTRPGEHREPARPGTADTRDRRRAWGHCGSGHAGQPAAGPSTHPATVSDRNGTPMCGTGQHARLTARSVAWCSTSIWSAPDGSGLLTSDGSSVQTDPDRSRRSSG